jgi:ribonuclease G
MTKELIVSATRRETRVAVIEDEQVVEVYFQRENEYSLAGSIHKGRVTRVLPGMQSAFVDIGLERDAFLYVSDFFEDNEEYDKIVSSVEDKILKMDKTPAATAVPVLEAAPPARAEEPVAEAAAPPSPAPAAGGETAGAPRNDRQDRSEDRDGRDRRGRRSRRRRSRGRGLPESKFYSPGTAPRQEPEPESEPEAPVEAVSSPEAEDDFFVLPGESLAKYSHPTENGEENGEREPEADAEAVAETEEEESAGQPVEVAAAPAVIEEVVIEEVETKTEPPTAEEPAPEPAFVAEPVVAAPVEETPASADEEPAPVAEAAPEEVSEEEEAVPEKVEEAAVTETGEFAQAVAAAEEEAADETGEEIVEEASGDLEAEATLPAEDVEAQAIEEGPEPARIPTSLTATLREQGPRYLHRVSRRMRRKNRGGGEQQPRNAEPGREFRQPEQRNVVRDAARPDKSQPSIQELLREGQEIIVQIAKEPLGQKGARITSHIALPGRFLVYMPTVDHIGVSRKIASDEERARLKRVLQSHRSGIPGGYIVRTAGEGRTEEELRADMMFLYNLWLDMRQKAEKRPAPALIHHDLDVVERVLRDQLTLAFKTIWVDNEEVYESVLRFVQRFQPALVGRVKMYTRPTPIFDEFGITAELEKALRPKVWLKSGGYIVINQTEALVAIDVNTGKYVGKSNRLEDTIVKTNTDAIKEIVRQIRLRDLGGIIVVDFIDMDERKNRQKVMQALEEAMRSDRAPNKILQFNDFGLVAITRKRVKQSLERTLCAPCPYCEGAGYVKSVQTIVGEILQEAQKIAKALDSGDVMLRVNSEVAKVLKSNQNTYLQEIEETLGRTVIVKGDPLLHQEKFDLA